MSWIDFSLIGVSETKINCLKDLDFNPNIPGYAFEHVLTPLASGGVGVYVNDSLKYTVIEKNVRGGFPGALDSNPILAEK